MDTMNEEDGSILHPELYRLPCDRVMQEYSFKLIMLLSLIHKGKVKR